MRDGVSGGKTVSMLNRALEMGERRMAEVSQEDFEKYEQCRESGATNMFSVSNVEDLTGLSRDKIRYIMENYADLKEEYCNV